MSQSDVQYAYNEAMVREEEYCTAFKYTLPPTTGRMPFWLKPVIMHVARDALFHNDLLQRDSLTQRCMKNKREKRWPNVVRQRHRAGSLLERLADHTNKLEERRKILMMVSLNSTTIHELASRNKKKRITSSPPTHINLR